MSGPTARGKQEGIMKLQLNWWRTKVLRYAVLTIAMLMWIYIVLIGTGWFVFLIDPSTDRMMTLIFA
jgi:hypothetical protein